MLKRARAVSSGWKLVRVTASSGVSYMGREVFCDFDTGWQLGQVGRVLVVIAADKKLVHMVVQVSVFAGAGGAAVQVCGLKASVYGAGDFRVQCSAHDPLQCRW